jgi:hypothetical protein
VRTVRTLARAIAWEQVAEGVEPDANELQPQAHQIVRRPEARARSRGTIATRWCPTVRRGAGVVVAVTVHRAYESVDQLVRCEQAAPLHVDERPSPRQVIERRTGSPVATVVVSVAHTNPLPPTGWTVTIEIGPE